MQKQFIVAEDVDSSLADAEPRVPRGEATDAVYNGLREMAHNLGPNAKLPPVRQLREQFGVSRSTLDAALGRLEGQRVLLRRERSGVYVAPHLRQRTVCLLCEPSYFLRNGASPFWSLLIDCLQRAARNEEIRLSVVFTNALDDKDALDVGEDPTPIPDWLRADVESGKVHGILTVGLQNRVARWIEARNVPVVAYAGAAKYIVTTPMSDVIQMGVAALARQGCKRICLWSAQAYQSSGPNHNFLEETFAGALAAHELPVCKDSFFISREPFNSAISSLVQLGWEAAHHYYGPEADPEARFDGILSSDDMITQGGLMALQRLGISVGETVQVASHANLHSPALLAWEDKITRLEFDLEALVRLLLETMDALIEGTAERRFTFDSAEGWDVQVPEHYRRVHPRLILPATIRPGKS